MRGELDSLLTLCSGIRAFPNTSNFVLSPLTFDRGLNSAILRYKWGKNQTCFPPFYTPHVEANLRPLVATPPPAMVDKRPNLQIILVHTSTHFKSRSVSAHCEGQDVNITANTGNFNQHFGVHTSEIPRSFADLLRQHGLPEPGTLG